MDFGQEVEWALFKGIEQEGPRKGSNTLFVVGDVPKDVIKKSIEKDTHLYFGAGGRFDYNINTIFSLAMRVDTLTLESPNYNGEHLENISKRVNVNWVIPYMWHGKPLAKGIQCLSEIERHLDKKWKKQIWAKADLAPLVFMHCMADTYVNSYMQGYLEDVLIASKER